MRAKKLVAVLAVTLALATTSLLAAEPGMDAAPSKAMREKMAQVHADMAQCLRSDKTMGECQAAMRAAHESMMGKGMGMPGMDMKGMDMKKGCGMMGKPSDTVAPAPNQH
jgi:hypothetical protein